MNVELLNDQLAREHSIDDYYTSSPWPIRFVENRRLAIIRDFMGDVDGMDVAEVGSGGGHVLRMFPRSRLTAIDVSDVYLDIARRNLAGYDVDFVKGEIDRLDFPAATFDRIICTEVLEHVLEPESVLAAMSRLLRSSGQAIVTIPNDPLINQLKFFIRYTPLRSVFGGRFDWGGDRYHLHRWAPEDFRRLLGRHFRILDSRFAPFAGCPVRACFLCGPKR